MAKLLLTYLSGKKSTVIRNEKTDILAKLDVYAFFISHAFLTHSQCCFSWIELQMLLRCCLIRTTILRHILCLVYLCPYRFNGNSPLDNLLPDNCPPWHFPQDNYPPDSYPPDNCLWIIAPWTTAHRAIALREIPLRTITPRTFTSRTIAPE